MCCEAVRSKGLLTPFSPFLSYSQLQENELELSQLHTKVHEEAAHLEALDRCKENEMSLQSQKWSEFSRLAENMKNLSQSMAYRNNCSTSIEYAWGLHMQVVSGLL